MMRSGSRRLAFALLAAVVGCGGETIGPVPDPSAPASIAPDEASANGGGPWSPVITRRGDTTIASFTVTPLRGGKYAVGPHRITFPAFSICDPETSGYGPETWDLPCTPTFRNTRITAKAWTTPSGRPQIEFSPALRFVPSGWPQNWVMLEFRDREAADETLAAMVKVLWIPAPGATPVDEAAADPTLRASVNAASGTVTRRLEHFSGYIVSTD